MEFGKALGTTRRLTHWGCYLAEGNTTTARRGRPVQMSTELRWRAAECFAAAQTAVSESCRAVCLRMAQVWLELAQKSEGDHTRGDVAQGTSARPGPSPGPSDARR